VFAVELGARGMLSQPVVHRAVGSGWHSAVWSTVSRAGSPRPAVLALSAVPAIDRAVVRTRALMHRS
jgi:hypothetical protein